MGNLVITKMRSNIDLCQKISTTIIVKYNLQVIRCILLSENINSIYRIETQHKRFIFKVYNANNKCVEDILRQMELLLALKHKNVRVSYPIQDQYGGYIQAIEAEQQSYGVLFSFIEGDHTYKFSKPQLRSIGRGLADMHNVTSDLELTTKVIRIDTLSFLQSLEELIDKVRPIFSEVKSDYVALKQIVRRILRYTKQIDFSRLSTGYCHNDFSPRNFIIDNEEKISLFDFDVYGHGYLCYDLMSLNIHFFLQANEEKMTLKEAEQSMELVLSGYKEVRHLSDIEIQAIPSLGMVFCLHFLEFKLNSGLHEYVYLHQFMENAADLKYGNFDLSLIKHRIYQMEKWMDTFGLR